MLLRDMLHVELTTKPTPEEFRGFRDDILAFNNKHFNGAPKWVCVLLKSEKGGVRGGGAAYVYSDTLFIDILWVDEELRGQDYGTMLVRAMEEEGRKRQCTYATVDTFDFQAEPFYVKLGYTNIGTIPGWINGRDRHFLKKTL